MMIIPLTVITIDTMSLLRSSSRCMTTSHEHRQRRSKTAAASVELKSTAADDSVTCNSGGGSKRL